MRVRVIGKVRLAQEQGQQQPARGPAMREPVGTLGGLAAGTPAPWRRSAACPGRGKVLRDRLLWPGRLWSHPACADSSRVWQFASRLHQPAAWAGGRGGPASAPDAALRRGEGGHPGSRSSGAPRPVAVAMLLIQRCFSHGRGSSRSRGAQPAPLGSCWCHQPPGPAHAGVKTTIRGAKLMLWEEKQLKLHFSGSTTVGS